MSNNTDIQAQRIYKQAKIVFYFALALALASILISSMMHLKIIMTQEETYPLLQSYAIMLTLAFIPFSHWHFSKKQGKLKNSLLTPEKRFEEFRRNFFVRLLLLTLTTVGNVICLFVVPNRAFLCLSLMSFVAMLFASPSEQEIYNLRENRKRGDDK